MSSFFCLACLCVRVLLYKIRFESKTFEQKFLVEWYQGEWSERRNRMIRIQSHHEIVYLFKFSYFFSYIASCIFLFLFYFLRSYSILLYASKSYFLFLICDFLFLIPLISHKIKFISTYFTTIFLRPI